ncbi:MAG: DUF1636 domain-containing protein [Pseudomonadota bacterium]
MKDASDIVGEVELLVCATCRREGVEAEGEARPGARLEARLREGGMPEGVRLARVECLSNCSRGCTVALRGPGRWTYVYGNLDPDEHAETLREGAAQYRAAPDGLIPWRQRPEHFKRNCIARIPPIATIDGALDD